MSIVRISHNKENPYVMLNKGGLEDKNLSWAAKGLWAYLISRPDHWNVSVKHLSKIYDGIGGGETAIYSLLNELIENGYCTRIKAKDSNGTFLPIEYVVQEFKKCLPHPAAPDVDAPDVAGLPLSNNRYIQRNESKGKQDPPPPILSFGKYVKLTKSEHDELIVQFGEAKISEYIESINLYCESVGRVYKGYAATIRSWIGKDLKQPKIKPSAPLKTSHIEEKDIREDLDARMQQGRLEVPELYYIKLLEKSVRIKDPDLAKGYKYKNSKGDWVLT